MSRCLCLKSKGLHTKSAIKNFYDDFSTIQEACKMFSYTMCFEIDRICFTGAMLLVFDSLAPVRRNSSGVRVAEKSR